MKTKISFAFVLCCCLMVAFNSCQKETIVPAQITKSSTTETETFIDDLMKDLPNTVSIEPVSNKTIRTIPFPFPTDVPVDCRNANCFQLTDTYKDLQKVANYTCGPIRRSICCCFKGSYRCFIMGVLPNKICPDTLKTPPTDVVIIDERVPISLEIK